jgi:hypothetical protein
MGWASYAEPIISPAIAPNIFRLKRNDKLRDEKLLKRIYLLLNEP